MSETNTKPYELKTLNAEHIFPMFNIINKIGVTEFKTFIEGDRLKTIISAFKADNTNGEDEDNNTNGEDVVTKLGISIFVELASIIITNLPKCENDIFHLLSSVSNLSVDEVRKLDLATFTEMIIDFVKKEEFKDFIKVVSKLFK